MQRFAVVLLAQVISMFGSGLSRFAMGIWIYQQSGSVTRFALAAFCSGVPPVLLLPFAGSFVDRWDRRRAMILADGGAGASTLLLALLMWTGHAQLWHLYGVIAVSSAFGSLQFPAFSAATTQLVPRERLGQANGTSMFGYSLASLLSPLLAGYLSGRLRLGDIVAINTASCGLAVLLLLMVRIPPATRPVGEAATGASLWAESLYGWRYIRTRRGLVVLLAIFAVVNFVTGLVQTLIVPMVLSIASPEVLGTVVTRAGLGLVAGGVLMSLWKGPRRRVRALLLALVLQGLVLLLGGVRADTGLIAAAAFLYLACVPVINTCSQTIWQRSIPQPVQGRVFAIRLMLANSAAPLGPLVAGPLADKVFEPLLARGGALAATFGPFLGVGPGRGIGLIFMLVGVFILTMALLSFRQPQLRRLEAEPPASDHATLGPGLLAVGGEGTDGP